MDIIQLTNFDGYHIGLFVYDSKHINPSDLQKVFNECERKALMAEEQQCYEDDEQQDSAYSIFENYLSEHGIKRVFAEEVYTTLL